SAQTQGARPSTGHAPALRCRNLLLQVVVDELGHLEHRDAALATEHATELVVGVDHPTLPRVLEIVLLDVRPDLLRDLGARLRRAADDRGQIGVRLHGLHECRIRCTLRTGPLPRRLLRGLARRLLRALASRCLLRGLPRGLPCGLPRALLRSGLPHALACALLRGRLPRRSALPSGRLACLLRGPLRRRPLRGRLPRRRLLAGLLRACHRRSPSKGIYWSGAMTAFPVRTKMNRSLPICNKKICADGMRVLTVIVESGREGTRTEGKTG